MLTEGLPENHMGKIGLAISPQQPDVLYAAIELDRRTGERLALDEPRRLLDEAERHRRPAARGPHYYQELYASPHRFDRIYLADVRMQVSEDGGKTFRACSERSTSTRTTTRWPSARTTRLPARAAPTAVSTRASTSAQALALHRPTCR